MAKTSIVELGRQHLNEVRGALHDAADDFRISNEEFLELRRTAQRVLEDQEKLERKSKGFFSFLGL